MLKRTLLLSILSIFFVHPLWTQSQTPPLSCEKVQEKLADFQLRLHKINTVNPEFIPLHYFLIQDIENELKVFFTETSTDFPQCAHYTYYDFISQYDDIAYRARNLKDTLFLQKRKVDTLFYEKSLLAIQKNNKEDALFFVNRALQYNRINPDALILKLYLEFEKHEFDKCIEILHTLQHETVLLRKHEIALSDFTLQFYDTLFLIGDQLLQDNREAEALEMFKTLEHFCKNMPTYFCNDDYYKGIIRSKMGVYHSYLKISKIAAERGYSDIAFNFLQYARDYVHDNENEISDTSDMEQWEAELLQKYQDIKIENDSKDVVETLPEEIQSIVIPTETLNCDTLFAKGFRFSVAQRTSEALDIFLQMKKQDCPCHYLDIILDILNNIK